MNTARYPHIHRHYESYRSTGYALADGYVDNALRCLALNRTFLTSQTGGHF